MTFILLGKRFGPEGGVLACAVAISIPFLGEQLQWAHNIGRVFVPASIFIAMRGGRRLSYFGNKLAVIFQEAIAQAAIRADGMHRAQDTLALTYGRLFPDGVSFAVPGVIRQFGCLRPHWLSAALAMHLGCDPAHACVIAPMQESDQRNDNWQQQKKKHDHHRQHHKMSQGFHRARSEQRHRRSEALLLPHYWAGYIQREQVYREDRQENLELDSALFSRNSGAE
ncbi:MAG: hypothetical protein KTR19_03525 [Hyphomicrobiales bacterium]|nr:hypothetical protein [Hyphomicrobiales bacterium]